ncbi:MAG: trypsin-like peptidase domain-containing protein [Myxococcota bacterium]
MLRLTQTFGAHTGRVVEFDQDLIRLGRLPESDVAFDPDADLDASGRHAEIQRVDGKYILVDSGSRNGTWVNGIRITRQTLRTGDVVECGHGGPRLRVEIGDEAEEMTGPMDPAGAALVGGMNLPRRNQPTAAATPVRLRPPSDRPGPVVPPSSGPPPRRIPESRRPEAPPGAAVGPPIAHAGAVHPIPPTPSPGSVPAVRPGGANHAAGQSAPGSPSGHSAPGTNAPGTSAAGTNAAGTNAAGNPSEKKYGANTVGLMIQDAVAQATQSSSKPRSTAYIRAVAQDAASRSSRGLKWAVGLLSLGFLLALAALAVVLYWNFTETDEARRQTEELQHQIDQQGPAGTRITDAYSAAMYLLIESGSRGERGICSAFAVRPDLLATNAHCVLAMERAHGPGVAMTAMPNDGASARLPIVGMWFHPEYVRGGQNPSPDVGLVQVAGTVPVQVVLATQSQLQELRDGEDIFVYGFPGDLSNPQSPVATITNGVIGRMTAFDGTPADFSGAQLIQHSAFTSPGTSGSPIFNAAGLVVAVNAGTFRGTQQQDVVGPGGREQQTVVTESGYKYGVRADLLAALISGMGR